MPGRELYKAAQAFQKMKLWDLLYDKELFAVRFDDGETGYVSIMGRNREHFALALYMGNAGLQSFLRLASLPGDASYALQRDAFLCQECLMCSFEERGELTDRDLGEISEYGLAHGKRMPQFRKSAPYTYPWYITGQEEQRLAVALRAAAAVAGRIVKEQTMAAMTDPGSTPEKVLIALGFTAYTLPVLGMAGDGFAWTTEQFPNTLETENSSPVLMDELAVNRLKKQKPKKGRHWYCHLMMLPHAMEGEPPRFPVLLLLLDSEKGMAMIPPVERYPEEAAQVASGFIDYLSKEGLPECVHALGRTTWELLSGLAGQTGLRLEKADRLPELEEAEGDLLAYLESGRMAEPEEPAGDTGGMNKPAGDGGGVKKPPRKPKKVALKSVGTCQLCGEEVDASKILAHLKKCVASKAEPGEQAYFMLKVEGAYAPEYFLYLDVMADTTLKRLDKYLRDIWLECCGHMSAFAIQGTTYLSAVYEPGDRGMSYKLENLVDKGQAFGHEYDFGSTTHLKLKVADIYTAQKRRSKIELLARNKAPCFACVQCGEPAVLVWSGEDGPLEEMAYCEDCANGMEDADSFLPIVNSPRCGVCGYGAE